ncbi:MAG: hypothetical protein JW952_06815 [Candidatus Eisenbacteria bacterium]|nr:hypothetical protein [Candidatus Eisenbacteria bacterium]
MRSRAIESTFLIGALALLVFVSCGDDETTSWPRTLEGTWDLVGYSDHGVSGVTTGTASFLDNGTFSVVGTVTYPSEPADTVGMYGTYEVNDNIVTLTTTEGSGDWALSFSTDQVVLTRLGVDPATVITLKRRP